VPILSYTYVFLWHNTESNKTCWRWLIGCSDVDDGTGSDQAYEAGHVELWSAVWRGLGFSRRLSVVSIFSNVLLSFLRLFFLVLFEPATLKGQTISSGLDMS
jgi:hypothetical protein